jgi:hypothetical protein
MSPLATTGMRKRGLDGGNGVVLGMAFVALLAGATMHGDHLRRQRSQQRGPAPKHYVLAWHQPVRIFKVTGTLCGVQASTTACNDLTAPAARLASSAEPAHLLHTFLAGQPMLMSMICAPRSML